MNIENNGLRIGRVKLIMKIINKSKFNSIFHSLRTELLIYYTVVSLVVLATGSYIIYKNIMKTLQEKSKKYVLQQFQQDDHNIQGIMDEVDRLSKLFAYEDKIQQFLKINYNYSEYETIDMYTDVLNVISDVTNNYKYINSIYMYTENKEIFGGSNSRVISTVKGNEENKFYSYGNYKNAILSFPDMIWDGGIGEGFFNPDIINSKVKLVSAERAIKLKTNLNKTAVVVFNIDERYLSSLYASSLNNIDSPMYIIDGNGKIISRSDGGSIGNYSPLTSKIIGGKNYTSLILKSSGVEKQMLIYKLRYGSWYLVREIPIKFFTEDALSLQKTILLFFVICILIIFVLSIYWLKKITRPLYLLDKAMRDAGRGNLGITISKVPQNEIGFIIKRFNEMTVNISDLIKRNEEQEKRKRELEIETLQAQINPHFLYNTLNMIKWMGAVIKAKNIVESIVALSNILRPIFSNPNTMCSIKEEIEYLDNYIKIMNWRFGNKISFLFNIPKETEELKIPRFILQPLIENSISHGIEEQMEASININIEANIVDNILYITVYDTGTGISEKELLIINERLRGSLYDELAAWEKGIGLTNVNRRIGLNFGVQYGIKVESIYGEGTKITLNLPKTT